MKRKNSGKHSGPSQRQLRVGELFRHRLCEVFARNELTDTKLDMRLITVTEVSASPDLRNATAFIMPLGGVGQQEAVTQLNQLAPRFRPKMSPPAVEICTQIWFLRLMTVSKMQRRCASFYPMKSAR